MHDMCGMQNLQRLADLARVIDRIGFADRILQPIAQAAAGKIFQRQIQIVIGDAVVQHIGDRAMVQRRENFAFADEALPIGLGHLVPSFESLYFERDGLRQIDRCGQDRRRAALDSAMVFTRR